MILFCITWVYEVFGQGPLFTHALTNFVLHLKFSYKYIYLYNILAVVCLYTLVHEYVCENKLNIERYRHKKRIVRERHNTIEKRKEGENKIVKETHNYTELYIIHYLWLIIFPFITYNHIHSLYLIQRLRFTYTSHSQSVFSV